MNHETHETHEKEQAYQVKAFPAVSAQIVTEGFETFDQAAVRYGELVNSNDYDAVYLYVGDRIHWSYASAYQEYLERSDEANICVWCGVHTDGDGYCWNSPFGRHAVEE